MTGKGVGNIAQGIGNAVTNQNGEQGWNNAMDQISKGSAQVYRDWETLIVVLMDI